MAPSYNPPVTALLGPTNTGKTWYALERLKTHGSGVIGFPLRLLARENYDRLCAELGPAHVALVTGEEKIIPAHARYFMCTVEAMPLDRPFDFVGIDEIQLCADPDRGHVFTHRLLHVRGTQETMFMGAETIRPVMARLLPNVNFETRPRLSSLTYTGFAKMTRLPRRSAVVAFSVEDVYRIADMIRARRGGAAVVLGALSPRTRNAQVAMYQAGEVDYLVATDAIGMGLNMDIRHVALAATRKFDGQKPRRLTASELAQIAGRAGRHMKDGTFGVTDNVTSLDEQVVEAIETHRFDPLEYLVWRNHDLDFASVAALVRSLERAPDSPYLARGYPSDDYLALQAMQHRDDVMARIKDGDIGAVRLLWEVCQIPDFRKTIAEAHNDLLAQIFIFLQSGARLENDWVARQVDVLDNTSGDVDALMARIAHVRTWTYIANRAGWLEKAVFWQGRTRQLEDALSDALHDALTKRFVDRRAAALGLALEGGAELLAGIRADGTVVVEGHEVGSLKGLRFTPDENVKTKGREGLKVLTAARKALLPEIERRMNDILSTKEGRFSLNDDGQIFWQPQPSNPLPGDAVAKLKKGRSLLAPEVAVNDSDLVDAAQKDALRAHIQGWLDQHLRDVLQPLFALTVEEGEGALTASARGIGFQLFENLGVMHRADLEDLIAGLDPDQRRLLRGKGVRLGPILVFLPALVKPAAIRMRALLWGVWNDKPLPVTRPADGRVSETLADPKAVDRHFYRMIGYPVFGPRAIRIDMLDRVITDVYDTADKGVFEAKHKYAEWLGSNLDDLHAVLESMGHRRLRGDKPAPAATEGETPAVAAETEHTEHVVQPLAEHAGGSMYATTEVVVEEQPVQQAEAAAEAAAPATAKPAMPETVKFILKRGKMSDRPQPRQQRPENRGPENRAGKRDEKRDFKKADKAPYDPNKPRFKTRDDERQASGKRHKPKEEKQARIMSFGPAKKDNDDDDGNPFAALKSLLK